MKSYHDTTNAPADKRKEYEQKALTQEDKILAYFRRNWHRRLSPSQVQRYVMQAQPITSVRRAITNLTNKGLLVKTEHKVDGPYGRPEYQWQYKGENRQEEMF